MTKRMEQTQNAKMVQLALYREYGFQPAEIISDAEAAAAAWLMLKKQQEAYEQNILVLRKMLQAVTFDDWNDWKVNAY